MLSRALFDPIERESFQSRIIFDQIQIGSAHVACDMQFREFPTTICKYIDIYMLFARQLPHDQLI